MKLKLAPLTPEAFAPYGKVIERPKRLHDSEGSGWIWWGENVLLPPYPRPYGIGYLELTPCPLGFEWAERHMKTVEMVVPAGGDILVYVGPPYYPEDPGRMPAFEDFRVFRIPQGKAVILNPGVWHGAPLAIDRPVNAIVLLLQGSGLTDCHLHRFPDSRVEISL